MYEIRKLDVSDSVSVNELEKDSFSYPWTALQIHQMLQGGNHVSLGAFENGRCIGYALFSYILDEGELLRIGVLQDMRRQGIATQLIKKGMHILNQKGVSRVFLEVREDNFSAIHMYESLNFIKISIRKNYYDDSDAVIYRWETVNGCNHIGN